MIRNHMPCKGCGFKQVPVKIIRVEKPKVTEPEKKQEEKSPSEEKKLQELDSNQHRSG